MTAKEIQKRNVKANQLRVLQSEDGQYFCESSKSKILYKVILNDDEKSCTCGDFARNNKNDETFKCKHILACENSDQDNDIESAKFLGKNTPKLNKDFIKNIKGKDFVLYAGVLDLAAQQGLMQLSVELIQLPTKENGQEAICRATAEGKNGSLFSDIGDANPNNCSEMIAKHLIRMASTRAKGRALRDMCNIGIACLEELESMDDVIGPVTSQKTPRKPAVVKPKNVSPKKTEEVHSTANTKKDPEPVKEVNAKEAAEKPETKVPKMSEAQHRAICNLSRRRGISIEALELLVNEDYGVPLEDLSSADASAFIRNLQQAA